MTLAQQRAQAAAAAAIARAQAHIRPRQPEPEDNPDDVYITPAVARAIRHRIEETNRHA